MTAKLYDDKKAGLAVRTAVCGMCGQMQWRYVYLTCHGPFSMYICEGCMRATAALFDPPEKLSGYEKTFGGYSARKEGDPVELDSLPPLAPVEERTTSMTYCSVCEGELPNGSPCTKEHTLEMVKAYVRNWGALPGEKFPKAQEAWKPDGTPTLLSRPEELMRAVRGPPADKETLRSADVQKTTTKFRTSESDELGPLSNEQHEACAKHLRDGPHSNPWTVEQMRIAIDATYKADMELRAKSEPAPAHPAAQDPKKNTIADLEQKLGDAISSTKNSLEIARDCLRVAKELATVELPIKDLEAVLAFHIAGTKEDGDHDAAYSQGEFEGAPPCICAKCITYRAALEYFKKKES